MGDVNDNRYHCSIENFIVDEYSICREERQYAVFLYNILRKYGKKQSREKLAGGAKDDILRILEACGIEADSDIEHVFYEATFMRDFFKRERRYYAVIENKGSLADVLLQQRYEKEEKTKTDFNRRLVEYAFHKREGENPPKRETDHKENDAYLQYNLGGNIPKECEKAIEEVREKVRAMMNSKPDIAVIYKRDSRRYLLFIECKFESSEATYGNRKNQKDKKEEKLSQRSVQYDVAGFLCDCYLNRDLSKTDPNYISVSPVMEADHESRMVRFMRSDEKQKKRDAKEARNVGKIFIKTLIDWNHKIFEEDDENDGQKDGVRHE